MIRSAYSMLSLLSLGLALGCGDDSDSDGGTRDKDFGAGALGPSQGTGERTYIVPASASSGGTASTLRR